MASALEEAACVEPLSKNVQRSRWFNLAHRMSQESVIASESRIQPSKDSLLFLNSYFAFGPLLEFNQLVFSPLSR